VRKKTPAKGGFYRKLKKTPGPEHSKKKGSGERGPRESTPGWEKMDAMQM